jgi:hypothetical protein
MEVNPYQSPQHDVNQRRDHALERGLWQLCLFGSAILALGMVLMLGAFVALLAFSVGFDAPVARMAVTFGGLASIGGTVLIVVSAIAVFVVRLARAKRALRR